MMALTQEKEIHVWSLVPVLVQANLRGNTSGLGGARE